MKYKKLTLFPVLLLITSFSFSQDVDQREQFKLTTDSFELSIDKGKMDSLELRISRAKKFRGAATITLNSFLQKGVFTRIEPVRGKADHFMLYVLVADSFSKSEFNLVPSCSINNKSKGIVIKVIVNNVINSKPNGD